MREHDLRQLRLAQTGFDYLHIDWRQCGCDDAVAIRADLIDRAAEEIASARAERGSLVSAEKVEALAAQFVAEWGSNPRPAIEVFRPLAALLVRAQEYIRLLPSRCLCEGLPRCARCEEDLAFLSDLDSALKGVER